MEESKPTANRIRTLLEKGKTPQEVIAQGYARSTVYAIAKKLKPKLELQPIESLEQRIRDLEVLIMQICGILYRRHKETAFCPRCAEHDFKYFEGKDGAVGYKCECGYRLEF